MRTSLLLALSLSACAGSRVDFHGKDGDDTGTPDVDTDTGRPDSGETDDTGIRDTDTGTPDTDTGTRPDTGPTEDTGSASSPWDVVSEGTLEAFGGPPLVTLTKMSVHGDTIVGAGQAGYLWISTDGGATWTSSYDPAFGYVVDAVAATEDGIFVATYTGVLLSTDDGATWTSANAGLGTAVLSELPTDGTTLYGETGYGAALYRWNGASWDAATVPIGYSMPPLVDGDTLYLGDTYYPDVYVSHDGGVTWGGPYAGGVNTFFPSAYAEGDLLGWAQFEGVLRRSTDGGVTWTDVCAQPSGAEGFVEHDGILYARMYEDGVQASDDDGASWHDASTGLPDGWARWTQDLVVTTSGDLLAGTMNDGPYRFDGASWSAASTGMVGGTPADIAAQGGKILVTFTTDEVWTYDPAADAWASLPSPDPGAAQLGPIAANEDTILVSSAYYGLYRSTDGGASWSDANSGLPDYIGDIGRQPLDGVDLAFGDGVVIDAHAQGYEGSHEGTMTATGGGLSISTNEGRSWTWIHTGLPTVGTDASGQAVYPTTTTAEAYPNVALVGTTGYGVYRSVDDGTSWGASSGIAARTLVTDLARVGGAYFAAGEDQNTWSSTAGNGVWRSEDRGQTWDRDEDGLPTDPQVMALAPAANALFALVTAPSQGIWKLDVTTDTWSLVASAPAGVTLSTPMWLDDDGFYVGTSGAGLLMLVPTE